MNVEHINTIDSTNEELRRRFLQGENAPLLIWADEQTAGKGRNGRSFYSPQNTGIYFSFLYPCKDKEMLGESVFVTTVAAVAVCSALREITGADAGIKWVNDVYVNGRKVCGILAEAVFRGEELGIVVGIGINLTTTDFPDEIAGIAAGVGSFDDAQLSVIKKRILESVGERLLEFFLSAENAVQNSVSGTPTAGEERTKSLYRRKIIDEYREMSIVLGKEVSFHKQGDEEQKGIAKDILEDGSLVVACEDGEHILNSGEIHLSFL